MSSTSHQRLLQARRLLILQYSSRLRVRSIAFQWPSDSELLSIQPYLLKDLGVNQEEKEDQRVNLSTKPHQNRRANEEYDRMFFKALISRLEAAVKSQEMQGGKDEVEVDDSIFEHYTSLLTSTSSEVGASSCPVQAVAPQPTYVTHFYPLSTNQDLSRVEDNPVSNFQSVTMREEGTTISRGTTGLKTWEASLRLAAHLLAEPALVQNSRVLELGSGVGLLGVICAQIQRREEQKSSSELKSSKQESAEEAQVWLTDVEGQVMDRLEETLELNGLRSNSRAHLSSLDWIELEAASRIEQSKSNETSEINPTLNSDPISVLEMISPSVIIAADVVFAPELISPLCSTLKKALQLGQERLDSSEDTTEYLVNSKALVASTIRNEETYGKFLAALTSLDLQFHTVDLLSPSFDFHQLPLFPTAHQPAVDGKVELLQITLQ